MIRALYTSVWDNEHEITTGCNYNEETMVVSDIEFSTEEPEDIDILTDEYIEINGEQLRKEDGIIFEY